MRASECAGYPSQLAAVRAMALKGMGKAEIRQRTGLDSHRVGSLLAKVRAEARGDGPEWTPALAAKARRIYRAGIGVMAEAFGVTMAEFLLHATGVPAAGAEAEGERDGDVDAAGAGDLADGDEAGGVGDDRADRSGAAPLDGDGADRPAAAGAEADGAGAAEAGAIEGDAAGAAEGRAGGDAAAGAAQAPEAAEAAEDSAVVPEPVPAPVAARGPSTALRAVPLPRLAGEEREGPVDVADPVANVGEGANGAIAAASGDPASRDTDGADRQQPAVSGFSGDATASPSQAHRTVEGPVRGEAVAISKAVAPLIADTEIAGEVHLRSWDGQRLHVNGRVLTRIPRFYWRGSRAAAEAMRSKAPTAWGALTLEAAR